MDFGEAYYPGVDETHACVFWKFAAATSSAGKSGGTSNDLGNGTSRIFHESSKQPPNASTKKENDDIRPIPERPSKPMRGGSGPAAAHPTASTMER